MKTNEFLQQLLDATQQVKELVEQEILPLSDRELTKKISSTSWSILQCVEHLNLYSDYYIPAIRKSILTAEEKSIKPTENFEFTWLGSKSIQSMQPQNKKKQNTFKNMNPVNSLGVLDKRVMARFLRYQDELLALEERAAHVNLMKGRVPLEFFRLLKMNVGDSFQFLVVHQQRHVGQMLTIKQSLFTMPETVLKI
jgi:uncharacterized damage-inducible protein DinB